MPIAFTPVYDTFWKFAAERQAIYMKRVRGEPKPWTNDPILGEYKFTNAYRASDRTSQYLIRDVIYDMDADWSLDECFFRVILFKLFNRIDTWKFFIRNLGEIPSWKNFDFQQYRDIVHVATLMNRSLFSPAYIMPSGNGAYGFHTKRECCLALLRAMMRDGVPTTVARCPTMAEAFGVLTDYPIIGNFLGYQFVTDLAYTPHYNWSEMDFVMAGPGAIDGVGKCFSDLGGVAPNDIIRMVTQMQQAEFACRDLEFETLWGRPLQLIDVQNLFCEISKYARVAHPEVIGKSGRTQIKAKHKGDRALPTPWFPPKWYINECIDTKALSNERQ